MMTIMKTKHSITILLNGGLIPKLINKPHAPCFLINLDVLLLHVTHFHKSYILSLLVSKTHGFMFSTFFFYTLSNMVNFFVIETLNYYQ